MKRRLMKRELHSGELVRRAEVFSMLQKQLLRLLGHRAARGALVQHTASGGALDIHLGIALLRDRRVPIATKLLALALGVAGMSLLIALELPIEAFLAILLPGVGLVAGFVLDGMEGIIGPFVLAALIMRRIAPAPIVATIIQERADHSARQLSG